MLWGGKQPCWCAVGGLQRGVAIRAEAEAQRGRGRVVVARLKPPDSAFRQTEREVAEGEGRTIVGEVPAPRPQPRQRPAGTAARLPWRRSQGRAGSAPATPAGGRAKLPAPVGEPDAVGARRRRLPPHSRSFAPACKPPPCRPCLECVQARAGLPVVIDPSFAGAWPQAVNASVSDTGCTGMVEDVVETCPGSPNCSTRCRRHRCQSRPVAPRHGSPRRCCMAALLHERHRPHARVWRDPAADGADDRHEAGAVGRLHRDNLTRRDIAAVKAGVGRLFCRHRRSGILLSPNASSATQWMSELLKTVATLIAQGEIR